MPDQELETSSDGSVLEFPNLEDRLGEQVVNTAAHVLNRDLTDSEEIQDDIIPARIRGIDTPEEIAAYRAVETRTRNRDRVHELLNERADWLKTNGYRPADLTTALLDPDDDIPDRYRLRVPLWVSTADLRDTPEIEYETPSASGRVSTSASPSSNSQTTQVTLADGGGRDD